MELYILPFGLIDLELFRLITSDKNMLKRLNQSLVKGYRNNQTLGFYCH